MKKINFIAKRFIYLKIVAQKLVNFLSEKCSHIFWFIFLS